MQKCEINNGEYYIEGNTAGEMLVAGILQSSMQ